jgi:hypothetical protein
MPFTDDDRKRLYESLKSKENVNTFFAKNREKLFSDNKALKDKFQLLVNHLQQNPESLKPADMMDMLGILTTSTFQAMSDLMDIVEIAFLSNIQTRERLVDVAGKSGNEQKEEIAKLKKEISDINKHKDNLEWLDKYFKKSSETSSE